MSWVPLRLPFDGSNASAARLAREPEAVGPEILGAGVEGLGAGVGGDTVASLGAGPERVGAPAGPAVWRPIREFRDASIPKLDNLRRAVRAGLRVPPTLWAWARELDGRVVVRPPLAFAGGGPCCVVRSGSPTEDTTATSNAGQLLSVAVGPGDDFAAAVGRVVGSLPRSPEGVPEGVVFIQPFVEAEVAGVTFFDGFYFEETRAAGSNVALTSGQERGEVHRGQVERGDAHHEWLRRIHRVFGGRLDLEWARPSEGEPVLLQARPALFPVRRCETLSLANHKEIVGDVPSPWIAGAMAAAGRPAMRVFESVAPAVAGWEESYAIELGERVWVNFSAFYRLMDHWGMPRTMVTEGVGGESAGPLDGRVDLGRLLRSMPEIAKMGVQSLWQIFGGGLGRDLRALDAEIDRAETLRDLQRVNTRAFEFSVQTNLAIISTISVLGRFRRLLGLEQAARVITQRMMAEYNELAARPELADRLRGLDEWLGEYGHRGPLESDPRRPRFAELREVLEADLARGAAPLPPSRPRPSPFLALLARPLFLADEYREWFRDSLMRRWQRLRTRILEEARRAVERGHLDDPDDVFFLRPEDLERDPGDWRARAAERREKVRLARRLHLPATAPRDVLEARIAEAERPRCDGAAVRFRGIGLGHGAVVGTAVRAEEVTALLEGRPLPDRPVLVVDTLEPSWAVVFSRFSAVVAELGGELSHASILLREAGIPAVVNARGAYRSVGDGDLVCVDPDRGEVRVEARRASVQAAGPGQPSASPVGSRESA